MYYLYTILMLAWDLDKDTHSEFRKYLNHFIYLRKISKNIRCITKQLTYVPYAKNIKHYKEGPHTRYALESIRLNKKRWWWREDIILRLPSSFGTPYIAPPEVKITIDKIHESETRQRFNITKEEYRSNDR